MLRSRTECAGLSETAGAVIPDRAEQRAVLVFAVADGLEVILDHSSFVPGRRLAVATPP
jgi:hypothetical protein